MRPSCRSHPSNALGFPSDGIRDQSGRAIRRAARTTDSLRLARSTSVSEPVSMRATCGTEDHHPASDRLSVILTPGLAHCYESGHQQGRDQRRPEFLSPPHGQNYGSHYQERNNDLVRQLRTISTRYEDFICRTSQHNRCHQTSNYPRSLKGNPSGQPENQEGQPHQAQSKRAQGKVRDCLLSRTGLCIIHHYAHGEAHQAAAPASNPINPTVPPTAFSPSFKAAGPTTRIRCDTTLAYCPLANKER